MNLEDFYTPKEMATYRRVKRGSMRLARIAREEVAKMVGGTINQNGKQFLMTPNGTYRMAMRSNSDNSTEAEAHDAMGAQTVVMNDNFQMLAFLREHGLNPGRSLITLHKRVDARMWS